METKEEVLCHYLCHPSDYFEWASVQRNILISQGLWGCVDGSVPRPVISTSNRAPEESVAQVAWDTKNLRAMLQLMRSMRVEYSAEIFSVGLAKEMWENIKAKYGQHGPAVRMKAFERLVNTTFASNNSDMESYCRSFDAAHRALIAVNGVERRMDNPTNNVVVGIFLSGLRSHPEYADSVRLSKAIKWRTT